MKYRADIDGLRAIAVVSVCIYHAFPSILNGGFVGVDIFFVISGFLITSIILTSIENKNFSILDFYSKRIKRIFPSLIIVIISVFLLGWYILFDSELYVLIKHIFFGSIFSSNFLLWSEAGYFDSSATEKPLLHLWSLAIEEQFYIFWPLLLVFLAKLKKDSLLPISIFILISFSISIFYSEHDQSTAFYMPFSRFWEIAFGGFLAAVTFRSNKYNPWIIEFSSIIGFIFLLAAILFTKEDVKFPGYWALIPVIGTGLIIFSGQNAWVNKIILSHKAMVFFGLISFPLYLWHWIFISMLNISVKSPDVSQMTGALTLSFICAYMSYRWVEQPIRHSTKRHTPVLLASCMAIVSGIGLYTYTQKSIPSRDVMAINKHLDSGFAGGLSNLDISYNCDSIAPGLDFDGAKCIRRNDASIRFAVIGDSKADVLAPGLIRTNTADENWLFIGGNATDGAPIPIITDDPAYGRHQAFAKETIDFLVSYDEVEVVVIAVATRSIFNLRNDRDIEDLPETSYYSTALSGMKNGLNSLIASGKKIILMVDNPTLPPPQSCLERRTGSAILNRLLSLEETSSGCSITLDRHYRLSNNYRQLLMDLRSMSPDNIFIFNTLPILCDHKNGMCETFKENRAMYSFTDHISDYAAGLIGKEINQLIRNVNQNNKKINYES